VFTGRAQRLCAVVDLKEKWKDPQISTERSNVCGVEDVRSATAIRSRAM